MFDRVRRAIECRVEVNARNVSYQSWIRTFGYSECVRPVDPVRVNESDRKTARGRCKIKFGDRREHTMNGVHSCAGERGGVAQGVTAKGMRGPRLTLLRRQMDPLRHELPQWGQQETE
eukprot:2887602-Pleurochrysis_carterae.AAC.1